MHIERRVSRKQAVHMRSLVKRCIYASVLAARSAILLNEMSNDETEREERIARGGGLLGGDGHA
jgi:hypothetical protein